MMKVVELFINFTKKSLMDFSLFQLANIFLVVFLAIMLFRFLWMTFLNTFNQPAIWKEAKKEKQLSKSLLKSERFYPDKVRFYTWWIQVERLKTEKIAGDFAELGVYKGDSARILHQMDPSRKFHLLDTFEGFAERDLEGEEGKAATYTSRDFADTSLQKVIRKIGGNNNIRIHQGYFPDSVTEIKEERFALVNIDADLYNPTKKGLEFFYPRMNAGGVIFIHDYNKKWPGVVKAVDDFMNGISEVPHLIPDRDGTVLVIKRQKKSLKPL